MTTLEEHLIDVKHDIDWFSLCKNPGYKEEVKRLKAHRKLLLSKPGLWEEWEKAYEPFKKWRVY